MRRLSQAVVFSLLTLVPRQVAADALCAGASLADYIGFGVMGCRIDDKIFSNFTYQNLLEKAPLPAQITVTPLADAFNPGLEFIADPAWNTSTGDDSLLWGIFNTVRVQPDGNPIKDNSLNISGLTV